MSRKPLSTRFLRADGELLPDTVEFRNDINKTFFGAQIKIANISEDFKAFWRTYGGESVPSDKRGLYVSTVRQRIPEEWIGPFWYWGGVSLSGLFGALKLQACGEPGILLINGKLNGCILADEPRYAATFRWHDTSRPYPEQTATFSANGWSLHLVRTDSRCWCPQGGRILYA